MESLDLCQKSRRKKQRKFSKKHVRSLFGLMPLFHIGKPNRTVPIIEIEEVHE